jgi:GNAT superfamily N-acetyltransferase
MCITIEPITVADAWSYPGFEALIEEYAEESAIEGLPSPDAKLETYAALEQSGILKTFGAFDDDQLIGFIALLIPILPHYSEMVATTESFFVASHKRKGGAGLKLLHTAESYCRNQGAKGLLVSAPSKGRLAEVLPRVGYRESNRVFFRSLMCPH